VNYEVKRKDKQSSSSSTTTKAMTAGGADFNHRKGKEEFEKFKTGGHEDLKKNQYTFYRE